MGCRSCSHWLAKHVAQVETATRWLWFAVGDPGQAGGRVRHEVCKRPAHIGQGGRGWRVSKSWHGVDLCGHEAATASKLAWFSNAGICCNYSHQRGRRAMEAGCAWGQSGVQEARQMLARHARGSVTTGKRLCWASEIRARWARQEPSHLLECPCLCQYAEARAIGWSRCFPSSKANVWSDAGMVNHQQQRLWRGSGVHMGCQGQTRDKLSIARHSCRLTCGRAWGNCVASSEWCHFHDRNTAQRFPKW